MKLPVSALIFLANLDIDFTVNFLGRCRMNAVDGDQVRREFYSEIFPPINKHRPSLKESRIKEFKARLHFLPSSAIFSSAIFFF
jgi:hypothetical protein